ncbi:response regulator [Candidatus Nitrospira bockiana]
MRPHRARLLILDADAHVLTALSDTLRRRLPSITVDTATSLHGALRLLALAEYDLLLSEAHLPDAHGITLLSDLLKARPGVPLIIMGRQWPSDLMIWGAINGVHHFLQKPIEHNALLATVQHVLELRGVTREVTRDGVRARRNARRAKKAIAHARLLLESHEQLLARRREALAEAKEREAQLRALIDHLPDPMVGLDEDWRIAVVNRAACAHLFPGRSAEQLLDHRLWEQCPDWLGSPLEEACRRALDTQTVARVDLMLPTSTAWFTVTAVPFPSGLCLSFQKVTARDLLGAEPRGAALPPQTVSTSAPANGHAAPANVSGKGRVSPVPAPADAGLPGHQSELCPEEDVLERERGRATQEVQDQLSQLMATMKADLAWLEARLPPERLPELLKVRFMTQLAIRIEEAIEQIATDVPREPSR